MSRAFVREREGGEAFEELPDRAISPHPNLVTASGLAQIETELARLEREAAALTPGDRAADARVARDLRYWSNRRTSARLVEDEAGDTVGFGSTVTVLRADDTTRRYRIVGEDEADPAAGSIAYVAPLARALTGRQVGDSIAFNGQELEITAIGRSARVDPPTPLGAARPPPP